MVLEAAPRRWLPGIVRRALRVFRSASFPVISAIRQTTLRYTERGWRVLDITIAAMQRLEADWQGKIGKRRFAELKATLKELTGATTPER